VLVDQPLRRPRRRSILDGMRCLMCESPRTIGVLCTKHGVMIAAPTVASEQLVSAVRAPTAALVDSWGCAHGIGDGAHLGRDRERCAIAILHASVSSHHATFRRERGRWRIVDHASRNGTEIDGRRVDEDAVMPGDMVRFGEVAFYFWGEALPGSEPPRGQGRTARSRHSDPYRVTLMGPRGAPVVLHQRAEDGLVRIGELSLELASLEFSLLRMLVERRRRADDPELAYVAWHEIADALSFRSIDADAENVHELVHRVRRKLGAASVLIESKRGVGYRVAASPL
jgi:hypothetical protein